jgi:hypothetical protein
VVFLEYDLRSYAYFDSRLTRWYKAHGMDTVATPWVMVDSGHQITYGYEDFASVYRNLVNGELPRPPRAQVEAYQRRVGDKVRFYVQLRNLTSATLSAYRNAATLHGLVYENVTTDTDHRYVRAIAPLGLEEDLMPGATAAVTMDTSFDVPSGVAWDRLSYLVLADFQPDGTAAAFDMLQAAPAAPAVLTALPGDVHFSVAAGSPLSGTVALRFQGPYVLDWTASTDAPWLSVSPAAGSVATDAVVSLLPIDLSPGLYRAQVTFRATSEDGIAFDLQVPVTLDRLGNRRQVSIPLILR